MKNNNPTEGMRDLNVSEVELRNYVLNKILSIYKKHGFNQIETPCVERIENLSSGEGGQNEKMLFKILKRGEKLKINENLQEKDLVDLGLRFDLTLPLCRYYANNKHTLPTIFKTIQIGNVWRAERPQKGRFRQFVQCDIDIIGSNSILSEIELLLATSEVLSSLNFKNFKLKINDRRVLEALVMQCNFLKQDFSKLFIILDKIDKIGIEGIEDELLKNNFDLNAVKNFLSFIKQKDNFKNNPALLFKILPTLEAFIVNNLQTVIDIVAKFSNGNFSVEFDLSLVRGMGYYTGQIFEIETAGLNFSIAGGGRYDKLISKLLNLENSIPACGFSIGFERLITILEDQKFIPPAENKKIVVLYSSEIKNFELLISLGNRERQKENIVFNAPLNSKNIKKQLDGFLSQGFNFFILFDEGKEEQTIKELK